MVVLKAVRMLAMMILISAANGAGQIVHGKTLKSFLSGQGFTGELQGRVTLVGLGHLDCAERKLDVVYYKWEESHSPGLAVHASQRIIFIDQDKYLGSLIVDDRPRNTNGISLLYGYPPGTGNVVKCSQQGLPKSVLLNGELRVLAK